MGSMSTMDPRFPFFEKLLKKLQTSFSENCIFFKLFNLAEYSAIFNAVGFKSLITIFSMSNSLATRNPLAPIPDNPSRKILGP